MELTFDGWKETGINVSDGSRLFIQSSLMGACVGLAYTLKGGYWCIDTDDSEVMEFNPEQRVVLRIIEKGELITEDTGYSIIPRYILLEHFDGSEIKLYFSERNMQYALQNPDGN